MTLSLVSLCSYKSSIGANVIYIYYYSDSLLVIMRVLIFSEGRAKSIGDIIYIFLFNKTKYKLFIFYIINFYLYLFIINYKKI